jgi:Fe-S cluster assembly protein SufB
MASNGQVQDTGARIIHEADETTSNIVSKSVSVGDGRAGYRGNVVVRTGLKGCKNSTECASLLLNRGSQMAAHPRVEVHGVLNRVRHEASVSTLDEEKLFYLQQRGLRRSEAVGLFVNGFVNDLVQAFPLEYSVELKRLMDLEMAGSVG